MKRNNFRRMVFERDNFTCQKCKIHDKTAKILEAHHIIPLAFGGRNETSNIITLCSNCHYFSPNKKEEFDEYMKEECEGSMTLFMKSLNKVRKEHPDLFNKVREKLGG